MRVMDWYSAQELTQALPGDLRAMSAGDSAAASLAADTSPVVGDVPKLGHGR